MKHPLLALVAAALAALSTAALAQSEPQGGGLRAPGMAPGQSIQRVADSRPYGQLSVQERAQLHAQYERIDAGDEPPYPSAGMAAVMEPLNRAQAKVPVRGWLRLVADVDARGRVVDVKAFGTAPKAMAEFGAQVLAQVAFKPARCKGQPCRMQFPIEVDFAAE